jgi:hypothetical protein
VRPLIFFVQPCNTIKDVKEGLSFRLGVLVYRQIILFNGKKLEGDRDLASYGVQKDSTLHMVLWRAVNHSDRQIANIWKTMYAKLYPHSYFEVYD